MSEAPALATGSRRSRQAAQLVLLFALVGPPIGGIVFIVMGNVIDYAGGNVGPPRAMLRLIPLAYVPGIVPAVACGIFAALLRTEGRWPWIVATALFGAVAGLGGGYLVALMLKPLIVSPLPFVFYGFFIICGGVAALACALLAEKIGWRHGG